MRAQALADSDLLFKLQNKLSDYDKQKIETHTHGMVDLPMVERAQKKHMTFMESEFKEALETLEMMIHKYNANDAKDLQRILDRHINPEEATGLRQPVSFNAWQITRAIESIKVRGDKLQQIVEESKAQILANKKMKAESMKEKPFPTDKYTGKENLNDLKQQVKNALINNKTNADDIINVAITSGWKSGFMPLSNVPFRTIKASALYKDNYYGADSDGLCLFNGYTLISVNGAPLEYKAVTISGGGYANCKKGALVNGGMNQSNGLFSKIIWLLLVVTNLIAGIVTIRQKFAHINLIQKAINSIKPYSVVIGIMAISIGIMGFVMEFFSLNPLSNIIPQTSSILVGILLSAQFLMAKKEDLEVYISKIKPFTQTIGIASIAISLTHLITSGALYFI